MPLVKRVLIKNYRSIEAADVQLGSMTFLVGPNGSGKSNFLDAMRLVTEALRTSLDHALRERGGIQEVRRRSGGHPTHFGLRLDFELPNSTWGHYSFEVGARPHGAFVVKSEECAVGAHGFRVSDGKVLTAPAAVSPPASDDRLYLVIAAGLPEFRPVYDALSQMGFYSLNPDRIRALQPPDKGELLLRDGSNLASVLERLGNSEAKKRIEEYLSKVVPGIEGVSAKRVGHMETLEFRQLVAGSTAPWRFPAINMSDGTLRALGILVALFQQSAVPLVGIEEPEVALHPAAAGILRDALREGSSRTQVLVTSHSPELLDDPTIPHDSIIAVRAEEGRTRMGRVDEAGRTALRERLYTAGELLRSDQLQPEVSELPAQLRLFDGSELA